MRGLSLAEGRPVDVVAIGENSLDVVAVLGAGAAVAGKQALEAFRLEPGGQMATAALASARLGLRTRYIGALGDDRWAPLVRAPLEAEGVEVVALPVPAGTPSRVAVIIVDETGDRRIFEYRPPDLTVEAGVLGLEVLGDARMLLVDATQPDLARRAVELARAADVLTICDVDRPGPEAEALLAAVDVVVVPADLAAALTGEVDPVRCVLALGRRYRQATLVAATCGARGSVCCSGGEAMVTDGFAVSAVDTTGAGDTFRAGLAAGLVHFGPSARIEEVLRAANAAAALNCRAVGAQPGLPRFDEVTALMERGRQSGVSDR